MGVSLAVADLRCEYRVNPVGIGTAVPRLSWRIVADGRGVLQTAYQLQVAPEDPSFGNIAWDTGRVASDRSLHVAYGGGPLQSRTRYHYRVRVWDNHGRASPWSEPAFWETGLLSAEEWRAHWITPDPPQAPGGPGPCPFLRRTFAVQGAVRRARIYATSLGLYELHLNGARVGDCLFAPGWTSYKKRLQYQTYDVTSLLRDGLNALGAVLGDGWYLGNLAWENRRNVYGDKHGLLLQLHLDYADGRSEIVVSDGAWKTAPGPILMSDIYIGETYDARLEMEGWSEAGYDDREWALVTVFDHPMEILVAQEGAPVRIVEHLRPRALITTPAGETVLDMGQNMVGWMRFKARGPAGAVVTLRHAEVLDREGNFYVKNLRRAAQTVRYILRGAPEEVYEPRFTFQGFRYVKVEGYPGPVSPLDFTGVVIHSDLEKTGDFRCSDPLVNQLQHNIVWGQKGNFLDVPTDCPQRDERLGWTGDAQVFARTACFNMNAAPFYAKWLHDLAADQSEAGGVPYVVPHVLGENDYAAAAWGDAAVICPWTVYLCYGDARILEEQYWSMKAWVDYIRAQGEDEHLWNTGFHFGDWLALDAREGENVGATAKDFIATAFYAHSTYLLARAAAVLGRDEDARFYSDLHDRILAGFRREFVTPGGRLAVPTQTAHVLALAFGLVREEDRRRTAETLAGYIRENKNHLATGFVGTPYLCHVLSENGHNDLAYALLMQEDCPSWLYEVRMGATTIWEHWNGIKEDGSFWSPEMNSFNHYAFGAIGDWLYRKVAGLDTDEEHPGYKRIVIRPRPGPGLDFAEAALRSMYGEIRSTWRREEDGLCYEITVPPNTTAAVFLPADEKQEISEHGGPVVVGDGILRCERRQDGFALELGSGSYALRVSASR